MKSKLDEITRKALFDYLLKIADDRLTLGHRLSEWCGHGPILEEDVAITNIALDLIGQAANFLGIAAEIEDNGRTADDLAYFRDDIDFRNLLLTELPNGDYAFTIVRLFLFSAYSYHLMGKLQKIEDSEIAGLAAKTLKETIYHLRHSGQWILRFGSGTVESHERAQRALDELWAYTGEMFTLDEAEASLIMKGLAVDLSQIKPAWQEMVNEIFDLATLVTTNDDVWMNTGGRHGFHTEHLGHMLAEMQILARSHPGAKW